MEIQEEEMETLILMMMGTGVDLHPHQILHCLGEEGIGGPSMFMYCKDLQDHQARKGNLDNLVKQEEMAEIGNPYQ